MMILGYVCLILMALFASAVVLSPAKLGDVVYKSAISTEMKLYGFNKQVVNIGEMQISLYKNNLSQRETIMMLHGFSSDKDVWLRFARHFSKKYNVIIPDMAGHGETGFSKDWHYGAKAQIERLIKILDHYSIDKVHVIGNSMGGMFSAHFALDYPERTLSAGLVDPAGVMSPQPSDLEIMVSNGRNPFIIHNRAEFDEFYKMTMAKPPWFPDFIFASLNEKYQGRRDELTQMFSDFHHKEMLDNSLDQINCPTLLLWGSEDRLIHVDSVSIWQAGIKNIQVNIWPTIGHMPMLEIPKKSARVYTEFLESIYST